MRVVKKNVYYCDFCKKKGLRSLEKHEKYCTGNPNRECRLCKNKISIPELITTYSVSLTTGITIEKYILLNTFKQIRDDASQCPACTLTILRAINTFSIYAETEQKDEYLKLVVNYSDNRLPDNCKYIYSYDFKKDLASWWREVASIEQEADERETY